ncbi:2',3'-cyclic-nucleotide 2'-phosphodiesterase/3'-nucleotidase [Clostridium acetobutylicum]|uniref:2,3-cyclic-nucleotide 2'phosphodiesterase (Duplication) n=1 Tax=Clostridium acetobutylicum (strain ATCC 824 / DSM 792 / JCM 1419 / IAM 19013 / LMG 5710 / NBRC 13948 / NRRL B-527 / VKM B-1787 / 2291 / W) TaxID=272562 RepID=Q97M47_CLOAB|nr:MULTISPECIES: 5'-nucleotidase C-terminal domain-containing protein [Clostridium]AAK78333.1 2,3-cyclic-nucleotide 2'phosphodiesterase (duplication) [Clostridium acetobutylicum ATCC 824]ADZ19402.1 2,3-cyclic-nucleotide 2'phosphodiesterase (duplication) [Clostridium acetobutylicum EA 2018]AEI31192.1 2,3-cyclic-nucleotide 2'phosphodiesterase (duplication) [Clostridium acetobutylicum DSM 1731]AWV80058.1 LPXTG cell wall anchor domain-containing protein [Clostridium acetobutylicum]MBC2395879.1 LPX
MSKQKKLNYLTARMLLIFFVIFTLLGNFPLRSFAASNDKTFDLVEINDFHGALEDTSNPANPVASVLGNRVKAVSASNPDTIVFGGGDLYQGSALSNILKGVPVQKVMDSLGMQFTTLGNHEFDWGLDTLTNTTMQGANYNIICSNLYNKNPDGSKGSRVFDPYKIITKDGVRIAFIGGITNETPNIVTPSYVSDKIFTDLATEINSVASDIKNNNKADVIIAVVHEGEDNLDNIVSKLSNVNAVFGGHTNTIEEKLVNNIPVINANCNGKGFADLKMTVAADGSVHFLNTTSSYIALDNANGYKSSNPTTDPDISSIVNDAKASVGPTLNQVLGNIKNTITRTQTSNPYGESALGNWASDVIKNYANADIGISNNGGLRTDLSSGDVTYGDIYALMPFDNDIETVTLNKAQLKDILEQAVGNYQDSSYPNTTLGGKGLQVSGIKFTYDPSKSYGNKITSITRENETPINDTETLKLAGPDFVLTGGDGFLRFNKSDIKSTLADTHKLVRDALMDNVKANNTVNYTMDNRIVNSATQIPSTISILATSDIHGNVLNYDYATGKAPTNTQGLAKVSSYVNSVRASKPNVMLIDDGDTIQGTPLSYYYDKIDTTSEYPLMKIMGAMKYDTWTLGNHEFNYGLPTLNRVISDARKENINVLSANTYNSDNTNFVNPYYIKTFNINGKTVNVGILGLTTKCIPDWEDPSHYAGLHFNDLVDEAKLWVPRMKAAGANVVIVAAHSGEEGAADTIPENQIKAIATNVSGIDAIVAGHAHVTVNDTSLKNPNGKTVPVVEPNKWGTFVSQIDITLDNSGNASTINTQNVKMTDSIPEDPNIVNIIQPYQNKTLDYISTKLGTSTGEFTGSNQTTQPTAIMELINKVQKDAANAQLSIAAPLSSSAYIPKGDVTIKDIMSVYVYENYLYGIKMTGKQLKDWLEYSVRYYKQVSSPNDSIAKDPALNVPDYNLDQLYGATYDIDLTQPACTIDPSTGRIASGDRIKNLKINGVPIKDSDVFTVAINDYRYNGGGGFMKAAGISNTDPSIVTYSSAKALGDDGQVRSLMQSYIKNNQTISPENSNNWKLYTTPVSDTSTVPVAPTPIVNPLPTNNSTTSTGSNIPGEATTGAQPSSTTTSDAPNCQLSPNSECQENTTSIKTLPKTGSMIDSTVLLIIGTLLLLLGLAFIIWNKFKNKQKSVQ